MDSQVGFEMRLQQLATSVGALEGGDLGLDGALQQYEQSVKLLRYCYGLLDGAERAVALLKGVDPDGRPVDRGLRRPDAPPSPPTTAIVSDAGRR